MGAHHLAPNRAGTIRRVVRRGRTYICGLCRTHHDKEGEAQGCVRRCWGELLAMDPVIPRRRGVALVYRCRFCARDFAYRKQAEACAHDCRTAQIDRYDLERSLLDAADVAPARRFKPKPARRPVLAAVPLPKPRPKPKADAAAEAGPATPPISVDVGAAPEAPPPAAAAPAPAPAAAAGAGEEGGKKKTSHMFFRDGARYVCNHCKAKFFTKEEVIACFEAHPG